MTTAPLPTRRAAPALVVLAGHGLLLLGLWHALLPARAPGTAAVQPPLLLWLRPAPPATQPPPPRAVAAPAPAAARTTPAPRAISAVQPAGPATHEADTPAATWAPPTASVPAPPGPASAPPLDLRWRPAAGTAPGAADLLRQAPGPADAPGRDARLAQALGTDTRLQEQDRGAVRRFRQGRSCVDTRATRASQILPMDAGGLPRLASPC